VQSNPFRTNLKEVKNTLRLSIESVFSIDAAVKVLGEVAEAVGA
jgi:transcription-repair coupling factor (superfamily II helicase)